MNPKLLSKGKLLGPKNTVTGNWSTIKEGKTIESWKYESIWWGYSLMSFGNYIWYFN